ncbi:MAG: hypothetical protein ACRBN8_36625 [Nannocystales bacterium]
MTSIRALGLAAFALLTTTITACRPSEGERCICAGECAGGLVCAADGAVLRGGQCVGSVSNDLESGVCVDAGNVDFGDDALTPPPKFDAGGWATSGTLPMTTASSASETEATTTPEETSSSSGDTSGSESSSSSDASSDTSTSTGTAETGATDTTSTM